MIRLAYLQVGPSEHGVCRYGRLLAAEGRRRADVSVVEENISLSGEADRDRRLLRDVARALSQADLVHLQISLWSDSTWGAGWRALANLRAFRGSCTAPIVVTLHDVYTLLPEAFGGAWSGWRRFLWEAARGLLRPPVRAFKALTRGEPPTPRIFEAVWDFRPLYPWALAAQVCRSAALALVIMERERRLLHGKVAADVIRIPHFVEPCTWDAPQPQADAAAGKSVVIAGFISAAKGHGLMLQAMPLMPDVRVVFAGGPGVGPAGQESFRRLMELARQEGVEDRLEVTGYLEEKEFQRRIAAADLAVCPFADLKSASGSISTLIAAGRPILASDAPVIAEYNEIEPGAIPTFSPYTPAALAAAIEQALGAPRMDQQDRLARLREQLSLSAIYDQHLHAYRAVLEKKRVLRHDGDGP